MPVADIQFPAFDLLKNSECRDVLVGAGSMFPAIQHVAPNAKTRPAKMFSEKNGRFNGRSVIAGRKSKLPVVITGYDAAHAKSQCRQPRGRVGLRLVKNLITHAKSRVHYA